MLLGFLVCSFGILTLILSHNHSLTDRILSHIPVPGPKTSLAADPGLVKQMRMETVKAHLTYLSDREPTMVVTASVTNDALLPVANLVSEATGFVDGKAVASRSGRCGRVVSTRLLGRMRSEELNVLQNIGPPAHVSTPPGEELTCQVMLTGSRAEEFDRVEFRIVSVEPLRNHHHPRFASWE